MPLTRFIAKGTVENGKYYKTPIFVTKQKSYFERSYVPEKELY